MGNKAKYTIKKCEWFKKGFRYITSCGYMSNGINEDWNYCPYCGRRLIDMDRKADEEPEYSPIRAREGKIKGRYYKRR